MLEVGVQNVECVKGSTLSEKVVAAVISSDIKGKMISQAGQLLLITLLGSVDASVKAMLNIVDKLAQKSVTIPMMSNERLAVESRKRGNGKRR